ncbi:MAG: hypothetical protein JW395_2921 [Nitrospira sp.]|nr:hypothetical protein [Nitrospira sp.]
MTTPKVHSYAAAIATLAARQASAAAAAAAARSHVEKVIGVSYATACREADDGLAIDAARTAHADAYMYASAAALVAELAAYADAAAIAVAGEEEGAS